MRVKCLAQEEITISPARANFGKGNNFVFLMVKETN